MRAKDTSTISPAFDQTESEDVERLFARALSAAQSDDMESAREGLLRVTALRPDWFKGWLNYGAVCGELGRFDDAVQALETARRLDPSSREAVSNLGVLNREAGRLDASESLLKEAISMAPDVAFGHYNLGHTLFLAGRFQDAVAAYRTGLRLDPAKTPNQRARLSWALLATGDVRAARRELKSALPRIAPEEQTAITEEAFEVLDAIAALKPEARAHVESLRDIVLKRGVRKGVRPPTGR